MITRTDDEIKKQIEILWPEQYINVYIMRTVGSDSILIQMSNMYESPGLSFKQIQALAKFFDTLNVETESEFSEGGCETCDYGSRYGYLLKISPGDSYKEIE